MDKKNQVCVNEKFIGSLSNDIFVRYKSETVIDRLLIYLKSRIVLIIMTVYWGFNTSHVLGDWI